MCYEEDSVGTGDDLDPNIYVCLIITGRAGVLLGASVGVRDLDF